MPKKDLQLTKAAHFHDCHSWIGKRIHPGTDRQCQYLKGKDVEYMRLRVYERDKGLCQKCGRFADWDDGEMHHIEGGLGLQRCWCEQNLRWICAPCHRKQHVRVMWTHRRPR